MTARGLLTGGGWEPLVKKLKKCSCAQGVSGCSHLVALFGLMQFMQRDDNNTLEDVQAFVPNPPSHYKGMLYSLDLAVADLSTQQLMKQNETKKRNKKRTRSD